MSNFPDRLRPWVPGQPVEASRLQAIQDRAIFSISVGPGLRMQRVGNNVSIGLGEQQPARRLPYDHFHVKLVQVGGVQGTLAASATYTYDVYEMTDTANERKLNLAGSGAAVQPTKGRAIGRVGIADEGVAYFDIHGNLVLWDTNEKRMKAGCP